MSDRNLVDRWWWMMKIAPHESHTSNQNSWSEKSKNLISTEKKVYAIKIKENEHKIVDAENQLIAGKRKKKRIPAVKKWIETCQWKLPKAMILFSFLQVSKIYVGSKKTIFFSYLIKAGKSHKN